MSDEIIVATIGLGGTVLTVFVSVLTVYVKSKLEELRTKREESFTNTLPIIHEVYAILNKLKRGTKASRILILKTENGGGRPKIGSHLKSSVVYETYDKPLKDVKKNWQDQPLDEDYITLLIDLIQSTDQHITIHTKSLKEDSILRVNYDASGIKKSHIFEIIEKEKQYLYLSVNYINNEPDTQEEKEVLRSCVNQLRNIFSQNLEV